MRNVISTMVAGLLLLVLVTDVSAQDGFRSLFNGRDLKGWSGNPDLWSVQDGCITGRTTSPEQLEYNQFLIWEGTVDDFELRCEFRLEGDNNSGVQYRSVQDKEKGDFVCIGYQADIHPSRNYTGMMYDEKGRGILATRGQKVRVKSDGTKEVEDLKIEHAPINLAEWHELTILAKGHQLVHQIDGVTIVDVTDEQESERELSGVLALQIHRGPAMVCQFRNIRLKPLKGIGEEPAKSPEPTATSKKGTAGEKAAMPRDRKNARRKSDVSVAKMAVVPQWIWRNADSVPADNVFFRKEIDSGGVGAARLYAACDDAMRIYVDGVLVAESDNWQSPIFADISKSLDLDNPVKKHVIAIEAENSKGPAGLVVRLDLESGWREAWVVVSDSSWQAATTADGDWKLASYQPGDNWTAAELIAPLGGGTWADKVTSATLLAAAPLKQPEATAAGSLKVAKDFHAELLYSVPKEEQGSWVNLCADPKGRLIVSDQYGSLYRVTPPPVGVSEPPLIESIDVEIGEAQGLLWAFDSLYVNVNKGQKFRGGLYRVRDTDGDDQLDSVELLRSLEGTGEHGPHAVLPHPDGRSLVVVCGNGTALTEITTSRLPATWDEDLLLPRVKGRFMLGKRAPGGCIYKVDPDGREWELLASGFRNQFDAAFNREGELFTYDADMEWDINAPWYRPTRICHAVSGAEFGWRSSSGKWPVYYSDSVPPVINIGPGSPTGVCFGYGAKFPARYQNALFAADWSYGKLYAVHLKPRGATYAADLEEFVSGTPLPLTDMIVNPYDGAMYFTIGGRKVQSGLYRVTYIGHPGTAAELSDGLWLSEASARKTRRNLETAHVAGADLSLDAIWKSLASSDRAIRYAARVALEHRPVEEWRERALAETHPQACVTAIMALARTYQRQERGSDSDIDSPVISWNDMTLLPERAAVTSRVLKSLNRLGISVLDQQLQLDALRAMTLTFLRISPPNPQERAEIIRWSRKLLPAQSPELTSEIAQLLVYLQAPDVAETLIGLLEAAPTQEEQIDIARSLRHLRAGWTMPLYERYFRWYTRAATYRGGASFGLYLDNMQADAVANLSEQDRMTLKPILEAKAESQSPVFTAAPRPFVREWSMAELLPLIGEGLRYRDFDQGRKLFGEASCFACHRFDNQGGAVGPDLTLLSGRFSPRDLLESIIEPSKVISDQYASHQFVMMDGRVISGRIINLAGDAFRVQTNMLDPGALVGVDRKQIDEMFESKISMMPAGLLNTLTETEVLDLFAYLLSRGDRTSPMFRR